MKRISHSISLSLSLLLAAVAGSFAQSAVANADVVPHVSTQKHTQGGLTREQVKQELLEAHRNGLLHANPTQYSSEDIEYARRQLNTLAGDNVEVHQKALLECRRRSGGSTPRSCSPPSCYGIPLESLRKASV